MSCINCSQLFASSAPIPCFLVDRLQLPASLTWGLIMWLVLANGMGVDVTLMQLGTSLKGNCWSGLNFFLWELHRENWMFRIVAYQLSFAKNSIINILLLEKFYHWSKYGSLSSGFIVYFVITHFNFLQLALESVAKIFIQILGTLL